LTLFVTFRRDIYLKYFESKILPALSRNNALRATLHTMPKTKGQKDWCPVEVQCLSRAYHELVNSGSKDESGKARKMYEFYGDALNFGKVNWKDSEAVEFFESLMDVKGNLNHTRSSTTVYDRYARVDLPYIRNKLNVFWSLFFSPGEPDGPTGTTPEDILRLVRVMCWLEKRIAALSSQAKRLPKTKGKTPAVSGQFNGCVGSLDDDPAKVQEQRNGYLPITRIDDKEVCCGLDSHLMVAAGATPEVLGRCGVSDAAHLFDGCLKAIDTDGWEPIAWRAWTHGGPYAQKADQIPHLCELDDKTDAGMDREGREARRQSDGAPRAKKVKTTPDKAPGVPGQWGFIMDRERERTTQQRLNAVASIASSSLCDDQKTKIIAQLMEQGDKSKSSDAMTGPTNRTLDTSTVIDDAPGDSRTEDDNDVASE